MQMQLWFGGLSGNRGLTAWMWKMMMTQWHDDICVFLFPPKFFGQSHLLAANTKDFRNLQWRCTWWAIFIWFVVPWVDDVKHGQEGSILLTSGYWGLARHFNYIGDLTMCIGWLGAIALSRVVWMATPSRSPLKVLEITTSMAIPGT